ncbi:MAG TPA: hypothetical protein VFS27_05930 [Blastocatellia bacterium]|jgi:hypothetical protein|nr:hypothetical protein [Blastocatellia bacterium]
MNCKEFENIVNDLARLKMIDAASRVAGMAHAEICGRCASRLADEHALSAGLKFLAASDERKSAPAGVEAALLDAFRARKSNPSARPLPVQSDVWPRWASRPVSRRVPLWVMAAAAAILIAVSFIVYSAIRNGPRKAPGKVEDAFTAQTSSPQPVVKPEKQAAKDKGVSEQPRESRAPRPRRGNRPRINKPFIIASTTTYANESEYATDFLPLAYDGDQNPMERGQVIRVHVPRSALIAFGLPVDIERADTPVKADLLVGEDGMARAIRFVR